MGAGLRRIWALILVTLENGVEGGVKEGDIIGEVNGWSGLGPKIDSSCAPPNKSEYIYPVHFL